MPGMEQNLQHELSQTLSPQQIQYLSLLQMNMADLNEKLSELEAENPLVEVSPPEQAALLDATEASRIVQWTMSSPSVRSEISPDDDSDSAYREASQDDGEDISDYLRSQFDFSLTEAELSLLERMILSIDENGYLHITAEQAAKKLKVEQSLAQEAISYLKTLDPPGICAFDLAETLCIQLERRGACDDCARELITGQLTELSKGRFQKAAAAVGCTAQRAREIFELIKTLSPRPASSFGSHQRAYIVPDITVEQNGEELICRYNDRCCAHLNINRSYLSLCTGDGEAKEYVDKKLSQALWMAKAINSRRETIERIADEIVREQRDFFLNRGPLVPLQLRDISERIGVHESTVSRCVSGKYLECRRGVFPLKKFFSGRIVATAGTVSGVDAVKEQIRLIISQEDERHPLSDSAIESRLKQSGTLIARRTVAKYREELGFATASMRKKRS